MTNQDRQNAALPQGDRVVPLRRPARLSAIDGGERPRGQGPLYRSRRFFGRHRRFLRRSGIGIGVAVALVTVGCLALWWRLASGPIQLDVVTPWLASAIEENFGSSRHVEVGGTQIERTENGARPFASATSSCATPTARWWRVRRRPRFASPA